MKRLQTVAFVAWLAILSPMPGRADESLTLGGLSFFRLDAESGAMRPASGEATLQPRLDLRLSPFSAALEPRISLASRGTPVLDAVSWYTEYAPNRNLSIKVGRFVANDSRALLFPGIDWFVSPIAPATVFNGHEVSDLPENLARVTARAGDWFASLYLAPWAPAFRVDDYASPLFPSAKVKKSLKDVWGNTLTLVELKNLDGYEPFALTADPAYGIRAGYDDGSAYCALLGFYGTDRASPRVYRMVYANTYDGYRLYARRVEARIASAALLAGFATESASARFEGSVTEGRELTVADAYASWGSWQETERVRQCSYTAGVTLTPAFFPARELELSCGAEFRNSLYFQAEKPVNGGFLDRALYAYIEAASPLAPVSARVAVARSLSDGSMILSPSIRVRLEGTKRFELSFRIPQGPVNSELGQFAGTDNRSVALTVGF